VRKSIVIGIAMIATTLGPVSSTARAAERVARAANVLPPHEIITIVRSAGLKPVGKPTRKGTTYLLSAIDDEGSKMRVVVDGRAGEVISVTPVVYGREFNPMPPSVYDSGSPVYEVAPPVSRATAPIIIDEEPDLPVYRRAAPPIPAAVPVPLPPREMQQRELQQREVLPREVPPREVLPREVLPREVLPREVLPREVLPREVLPREVPLREVPPRDIQERNAVIVPPPVPPEIIPTPLAPPSTVMATPPEGDDGELLPPPPPRFPQRVNVVPTAKPKPAKSAAKPAAKTEKSTTPTD
jgi:hypothetical protein